MIWIAFACFGVACFCMGLLATTLCWSLGNNDTEPDIELYEWNYDYCDHCGRTIEMATMKPLGIERVCESCYRLSCDLDRKETT